jgi:hypothetical protein
MAKVTEKSIKAMAAVVPNGLVAVIDDRDPEKKNIEKREDTKNLTKE